MACNTATTNAIEELRSEFDVPFIGIEPAIKPASLNSKTKTIGILATKGTLSSSLFHKTATQHSEGLKIIEQVGEGLVEHIERGDWESDELMQLLKKFTTEMIKNKVDHIVLGCSHYPYLIPLLKKILPEEIQIIDSGEAVAKQTKAVLEKQGILNTTKARGTSHFYTNGNPDILRRLLQNDEIQVEKF